MRPGSFAASTVRNHSEKRLCGRRTASFIALTCLAVLVQIFCAADALAQRSSAGSYVIRNATVVTVSGPAIVNGSVLIEDGKIKDVGLNVSAPAGAKVIDGKGLFVYPGMIDTNTQMGLVEIPLGAPGTVDTDETGDLNPNISALLGVNPHSAHIAVTRVNGVTAVLTRPSGGLIAGQTALLNLFGTTQAEMALGSPNGLLVNFPTVTAGGGEFGGPAREINLTELIKTRDQKLDQLRKVFKDALAYGVALDAAAKDARLPRPDVDLKLQALVPYARGAASVYLTAAREPDIRAALKFALELKLKPIIVGGNDAWRVVDLLKQQSVPVIVSSVLDFPTVEDDPYDQLYENAAKLQKAGVKFCISTGDSGAVVRDLPYHAGMAAAFGLPKDEALKAVTLYAAQIVGADSSLGSIEAGKVANLVITDGDLLEARTNIRYVFVTGHNVPLTSHHTELYEQFKDRK